MLRQSVLIVSLLMGCSVCAVAHASPTLVRRAVIVGSNTGIAGRSALRFAHEDAENLAQTLIDAGQFPVSGVRVLKDPAPEAMLAALDEAQQALAASGGDSMLVLYYSGHADETSLFPQGKRLPLATLKEHFERPGATVRVGILDACRGGGWTQAKGLTKDVPFEVTVPWGLSTQGSVLLASSSGAEDAHESESLRGSFFTHHLLAGLRGAADSRNAGEVGLAEAFKYARDLTVRDTALVAKAPQHPSFDMRLYGRDDVVLTRVASSQSVLAVEQQRGPMEIVQLRSGVVLLELPEGERQVKLALPPGRYLIRRRAPDGVFARELRIQSNSTTELREDSLTLVGRDDLASKGVEDARVAQTMPVAHEMDVRFAAGVSSNATTQSYLDGDGSGRLLLRMHWLWGLTDRLTVRPVVPALSYRFGEEGATEGVVFGGLEDIGFSNVRGGAFGPSAGAGVRLWLGSRNAFSLDARYRGLVYVGDQTLPSPTWDAQLGLTYTRVVNQRFAMNLSLGVSKTLWQSRAFRGGASFEAPFQWTLGGGGRLGLRPLPLMQIQLTDAWFLDIDALWGYRLYGRGPLPWAETSPAGAVQPRVGTLVEGAIGFSWRF